MTNPKTLNFQKNFQSLIRETFKSGGGTINSLNKIFFKLKSKTDPLKLLQRMTVTIDTEPLRLKYSGDLNNKLVKYLNGRK